MTVTKDTGHLSAAATSAVLAELLVLPLPEPGLISVTSGGNGRFPRTVSLQFSGPAEVDGVRSWAGHFGVPVSVDPSSDGPATWHRAEFRFSGVAVEVYAKHTI